MQLHSQTAMHKEAQQLEAARLAFEDGGIRQAFCGPKEKALIGAFQFLYWLVKEEVAHTTKFNSLKDLVVHLGCVITCKSLTL